ncbi:hypothetical protein [Telluria aromaticivorans]|uniref:hypothetical protein n=1 Tax=Telluria aromaticivorans TaxID=2725995 RepID=UPI0035317CEF
MTQEQAFPERRADVRRIGPRRAQDALPCEASGDKALLLETLLAVRAGRFDARLPRHWPGLDGKVADAVNDIVDR